MSTGWSATVANATSRMQVYATAADRAGVIFGPGDVTYLIDVKQFQYWDGGAWQNLYGGRWKAPATDPVNWERVNVNGSSIAVGHPWSATGGRILTTLAYEMARRHARYGLISMCAAGAMAGAFLLTRE